MQKIMEQKTLKVFHILELMKKLYHIQETKTFL